VHEKARRERRRLVEAIELAIEKLGAFKVEEYAVNFRYE